MGFNTAVLVINDAVNDIARDPAFGAKLAGAIITCGREPNVSARGTGLFVNAATVVSMAHADHYQVCVFGRNSGWSITTNPDDGVPDQAIKYLEEVLKRRRSNKKKKQPA